MACSTCSVGPFMYDYEKDSFVKKIDVSRVSMRLINGTDRRELYCGNKCVGDEEQSHRMDGQH